MNKQPVKKTTQGQPSWRFASDTVEAFIAEQGGHMGPVTFDRRNRKIQPLSVAPWAKEKIDPSLPPLLKVLRGDFFCMPFGDNQKPYRGEQHPPHGETANGVWRMKGIKKDGDRTTAHLSLRSKVRAGKTDKLITLVDGHDAVYCRHVISGMSGPMNLGHHAMLKFPEGEEGGVVSTSGFKLGQVFPFGFEDPANGGYSILKPGATFKSLASVPTITGEKTDLSRYPARRGFEDLVQMLNDPSAKMAWTAVTFPKQRYVWFAIKDPRVLTGTIFWLSNGGRHYEPWNGRHVGVLGLEEVTSYFHMGLAQAAAANPFTKKGFVTALRLKPNKPLTINYIMATATIPAGFDRTKSIVVDRGQATLKADSGKKVVVPLDGDFLYGSA